MNRFMYCAAICAFFFAPVAARAAVIINEVVYDDGGTDDREFVELYNNGLVVEAIGGWVLGGQDEVGANTAATITAGTMLNPGAYYVVGQTGVLNVNQVVASIFENDAETIELRNGGVLVDALLYERNKGPGDGINPPGTTTNGHGVLPADVVAEVGSGFFGNGVFGDAAGTPLNAIISLGRFTDGSDTNKNGRDFGMRPSTPGTANNTGLITNYTPPNPIGQTVGTSVAGLIGDFVNARYIDPTVADANNPNIIPAAPLTGNRAIVAWDNTGGGNAVTSSQVFGTAASGFKISAYLETSALPQQFTGTVAAPVNFLGSEVTIYSIGSGDFNGTGLADLTDLAGNVGLSAVALPASDNFNGTTGLAWVYERTAVNGATPSKRFLYLVDANDGGDSQFGGNTPLDWTILQTVDLSSLTSGWFDLSISVDGSGNGTARFNNTNFAFTTSSDYHGGSFNVSYRENLQQGADGTPDAMMRPATFTVPEPTALALVIMGLASLGAWRRG